MNLSHAMPFGPLGDACFFLAALWIEVIWRKQTEKPRDNAQLAEAASA